MRRFFPSLFLLFIIIEGFLQIFMGHIALAQGTKKSQNEGIVTVSVHDLVSVRFEIRAKERNLVIPYCRKDDDGTYVLCAIGMATIEHFDGKEWIKNKPGYPGEVSGIEANQRNPTTILPNEKADFLFNFSPDLYHVREGKKTSVDCLFLEGRGIYE